LKTRGPLIGIPLGIIVNTMQAEDLYTASSQFLVASET
jgi:hypothetical protein